MNPIETEHAPLIGSANREIKDDKSSAPARSEKDLQPELAATADAPDVALGPETAERQRGELALRHERDRAQRYLDAADVILLALNLNGQVTMINRKGCELLGWTESELLGRDWMDTCLPARARMSTRTKFADVIGGDLSVIENPILARSGAERLIAWHNTVLRDDAGQMIGTLSSGTDITDQRRSEEARNDSEAGYRTLFEFAPVGIVIADRESYYIDANPSMCQMLGYAREELIGLHASEIVTVSEAGNIGPALRAIATTSDHHEEWEFRRKDASVFTADVVSTLMPDGNLLAVIRDVSDRKLAVEALRTTEERMRFALEHANIGIWDMDHATGVLRWSETMEKHYCVPAGTFGGTFDAFIERIHPDDRASMLKTVATAMTEGRDFTVEHRTICSDGTVRWLSGAGRTILGAHGEPVRGVGIAQDITARKQAEATLRQSETRKAAILDSVMDCIVTMDADGNVIEFNAAAERTFGFTKATVMGRSLADLIIPPSLRPAHTAGLARYLATGEGPLLGTLVEVTAVRADGGEVPVELAITAIRSEQAPMFTGVLRDISGRKQADETRARLAAIVDSSEDAIFSMELDGTVLTWNSGAERLYGYAASEVIGRNRALLVPADKRAELTQIMDRVGRGEAGEPFETQRVRKDGSTVDISLTVSPMTDHTGRVTGISTIARDISNRKRAEAEVRRLNDEIQLQRLRVFKATMRTVQDIVNNLLNGLQLVHLEGEGESSGEMQRQVDQIIKEAAVKLRTLGNLETVREKDMAVGVGIEYPGGS